jgi:hypothetical protein
LKRFAAILIAVVALLLFVAPAAAADGALQHTGRVLIATEGDLTVPAGEHADVVLVVNGTATVAGAVNTVVVIDGTAVLDGATAETVVAVRSPVSLEAGTVVLGQVHKLDSVVTRHGDARVDGGVRDIGLDLAGIGLVLGPALVLLFIGASLVAVVAGLALAGLAARQVRVAERVISTEPVQAFVVGLAGVFLPILLVIALFITIVGAPLAFAILFGVLPAAAFVGYLIAGIWIGEWLLARLGPPRQRERPYLAAVIGVLVLQVLAIVPLLSGIAGLFGYGALLIVVWRTFRGTPAPAPTLVPPPAAAALQGS